MTFKWNNRVYVAISSFFSFVCLFVIVASYIRLNVPILEHLYFLLYIIVYILIPGWFLTAILPDIFSSLSSKFLYAFYSGTTLIFIQYFLLNAVNKVTYIGYTSIAISVIIGALWFKKGKNKPLYAFQYVRNNYKKLFFLANIYLMVFLISSLYLSFTSTIFEGAIQKHADYLFHAGNVSALSDSVPLRDFRINGYIMHYYYFSDLFFAICKAIFPVTSYNLICSCGTVLYAALIVCSFWALYSYSNSNIIFTVLAFLLSLFGYSLSLGIFWPKLFPSSFFAYAHHLYSNVNAICFGNSLGILYALLIYQFFKETHNKLYITIAAAVMLFLLMGFKSPLAMVMTAAMCGTFFVLWIKKRKIYKHDAVFVLSNSAAAIVTYKTVVSLDFAEGTVQITVPLRVVARYFFIALEPFQRYQRILFFPVHYILACGVFSILFIGAAIIILKNFFRKSESLELQDVFSVACAIIGFGGYYLLALAAWEQYYFAIIALPFLHFAALRFFTNYIANTPDTSCGKMYILRKSVFVFVALCIVPSFITFYNEIKPDVQLAVQTVLSRKDQSFTDMNHISYLEFQGMEYIRDQTPKAALCATNRHQIGEDDSRFFYYSALSERQFYLEGFGGLGYHINTVWTKEKLLEMQRQNDNLYDPEFFNRHELAVDLGIDYIIACKRFEETSGIFGEGFEQVFKNDDIEIYAVL